MKKIMIFLIALIPILLIFTVQMSTEYVEKTHYVAVTNVAFSDKQMEIDKDSDEPVVLDFPAKVYPLAATNKEIKYTSSDESIATVDENGRITFINFGTVTITAQSTTLASAKDSCTFFVTDDKAHKIEITNKVGTLKKGDSFYIYTNIIPNEALDKNVYFSSSDTNVARVSLDGKVTALAGGETIITATTANGKEDKFKLKVIVPVTGLAAENNQKSLLTGVNTCKFPNLVVSPADATNKNIIYTSSNLDVATIDTTGNIIFSKRGSVVFTATTEDGGFTCQYTVNYTGGYITQATLSDSQKTLSLKYDSVNNEIVLDVLITPFDADKANLSYESSNPNVVKVVDGKLIMLGGGETTITIKANTGAGYIVLESKISISQNAAIIEAEDTIITSPTAKINYAVYPLTHTENVSFAVSSDIASISDGQITFTAPGTTKVTIKTSRTNKTRTILVTYKPTDVTFRDIKVENEEIKVEYDEVFGLFFDLGLGLGQLNYTYDSDYISFDGKYTFKAIRGGTSTITATSGDKSVSILVDTTRYAEELSYLLGGEQVDNLLTSKSTAKLDVTLAPSDITVTDVTYLSSDETIAAVDSTGLVTFKKAGKVTITMSSGFVSGERSKVVEIESTMGKIKSILTFEVASEVDYVENKEIEYSVSASPLDLTEAQVLSQISLIINGTSVGVESNKLITIGGGLSKVFVSSQGATNTLSRDIFVNRYIAEIIAEPQVVVDSPIYTITYQISPVDYTDSVTISLALGANLVSCVGNVLSFKASGSVEVILSATNVSKTIVVTYSKPTTADVYEITEDESTRSIEVTYGDIFELRFALGLDMGAPTYSGYEEGGILSLTDDVFEAIKGGETTIIATSEDKEIVVNVLVKRHAENLTYTINGESVSELLTSKTTAKIDVALSPEDVTEKDVEFLSSDETIATIDNTGLVTFKKAGKVTITMSSGFVRGVVAVIESTYGKVKTIEEFTISENNFDYEENKVVSYLVKVSPYDLTDTEIENLISLNVSGTSSAVNGKELVVVGGGESVITLSADGTTTTKSQTIFVNRYISEIIASDATITTNEYQISYVARPNDHTDNVSYSLSSDIATIESDKVIFTQPGEVELTIFTDNAQKTILISYKPTDVDIYDMMVENEEIKVEYGAEFGLYFDLDLGLGKPTYTFDSSYLTLTDGYIFKAIRGGSSTITATSGEKSVSIVVDTTRYAEELTFTINNQAVSEFETSKDTAKIDVTLAPSDVTITSVTYVSSDDSIASVDNTGLVTFKKAGVVTITMTSGFATNTAKIESTFGLPSDFNLEFDSLEFVITDYTKELPTKTILLGSLVTPSDYEYQVSDFNFISSIPSVATVDENGVITAVGGGETIISVSSNGKVKTINVIVLIKTSKVDITFGGTSIDTGKIVGNSVQLSASLYPADADDKTVSWQSNNTDIATVNNQGLVTFLTSGSVTITVTTNDTGVTDSVVITKIGSAETITISHMEQVVTDTSVVFEPNYNQNVNLLVTPYAYGLLDPENWDYTLIDVSSADETGIVSSVTSYGNGEFAVSVVISINKKLSTTITFSFGECSSSVTLTFKNLQSLEMALKNSDDVNFGLEEKRVFGTYRLENGAVVYNLATEYSRVPSDNSDTLYWFSSDTSIATVDAYGVVTFNADSFTGEKQVTITVSDDPEGDKKDGVNKASYTYTLVCALNVYSQTDYVWAWNNGRAVALHTTLGTDEDKVDGVNFSYFNDTTIKATIKAIIYGNGYTMNFNDITFYYNKKRAENGLIPNVTMYYDVCSHNLYNLTMKGSNYSADKEYYNQHVLTAGQTVSYCVFENYYFLYTADSGFRAENCIFRHFRLEALQMGTDSGANDAQVYLHNTIFYDVGVACIELQAGDVHISGFFDVYNFVVPASFGSTYEGAAESAYQTTELAPYVYKGGNSDPANWRVNVAIMMLPESAKNGAQPRAGLDQVVFIDTTPGVDWQKVSCSGSVKILWSTMTLGINLITPTLSTSRIQPDSNPEENLDKVRRTYAG